MAIIDVRKVRDAFVKAEVTDEAKGLELATDLDEALSGQVVTTERLETLEDRVDARFREQDAKFEARFAQAEADAERRANRHTTIVLTALGLAVAVIAVLMVVL